MMQLGKKINNTRLKFTLSLISACATILMNGDENIDRNVTAWVFPLMLLVGGMVVLVHEKFKPEQYARVNFDKSKWCSLVLDVCHNFRSSSLFSRFYLYFSR